MGGAGMYPVALGMLLGLLSGALALVLTFARNNKGAVIAAGLCLGGGAFGFSTGWLGYTNGLIAVRSAVAHVAPGDREIILYAGEKEASVCWKFGAIALALNTAVGAMAIALALRGKGGSSNA
jgi:hypothetical protein